MRVSSTPAQVSAVETWLQDTESTAADTAANPAIAAGQTSTAQPRDSAEGLLDLNVWSHGALQSRVLVATATLPQPTDRFAQMWSEHIFRPLQ